MAADPLFSSVSALLHLDDDFGDETGKIWTPSSGASLSSSRSKFGSKSLYLSDNDDVVTTPSSADFNLFSIPQFTVEFWVYIPSGYSGGIALGTKSADGSTFSGDAGWYVYITSGRKVQFYTLESYFSYESSGSLSSNAWHHVAFTKDIADLYFYLDGNYSGLNSSVYGTDSTGVMCIGPPPGFFGGDGIYFNELRLTRAVRYTGSFTPPTEPFAGDGSVSALSSAPSPLAAPKLLAINDFGAVIDLDRGARYIMEITGTPALKIPISSWQATLQVDRKSYVQCVVPGVTNYADELSLRATAGEEFVIYRAANSGHRTELARSPLSLVAFAEGPYRHTATLSGYSSAFSGGQSISRPLDGARSQFYNSNGNRRVRCSIDWFLRPGQSVVYRGESFEAAYINYYVPAVGDEYMDVGTR